MTCKQKHQGARETTNPATTAGSPTIATTPTFVTTTSAIIAIMVLVAVALVLTLTSCSQSSSNAQTLNTSDSTSASGTTVGAYKTPEYTWDDNSKYSTKTPSRSEISEIYTFTLEGKTYTLPCKASEFVATGWSPLRDTTVAANFCSKSPIGNGYSLNGDKTKQVGFNVLNTSNSDAAWQDCMVVGILVDTNSNVSFETKAGIKLGDTYAKVQEAYGATSYDFDQFGTMGFHFAVASDSSKSGNRWYGQCVDTLSVTPENASLYPNWQTESKVLTLRMENFGDIVASE